MPVLPAVGTRQSMHAGIASARTGSANGTTADDSTASAPTTARLGVRAPSSTLPGPGPGAPRAKPARRTDATGTAAAAIGVATDADADADARTRATAGGAARLHSRLRQTGAADGARHGAGGIGTRRSGEVVLLPVLPLSGVWRRGTVKARR